MKRGADEPAGDGWTEPNIHFRQRRKWKRISSSQLYNAYHSDGTKILRLACALSG